MSQSLYIADECISPHPRFAYDVSSRFILISRSLTRNIRLRRGKKVLAKVPLYRDVNTSAALRTGAGCLSDVDPEYHRTLLNLTFSAESEIYLDAMGFGMGCCCLQVCCAFVRLTS